MYNLFQDMDMETSLPCRVTDDHDLMHSRSLQSPTSPGRNANPGHLDVSLHQATLRPSDSLDYALSPVSVLGGPELLELPNLHQATLMPSDSLDYPLSPVPLLGVLEPPYLHQATLRPSDSLDYPLNPVSVLGGPQLLEPPHLFHPHGMWCVLRGDLVVRVFFSNK